MLMMSIIFAVCFVPIWPVLYFVFRNMVKPKKNIIIGVTLPQSEHDNEHVQAVCRSYLKWFNIIMLPLLVLIAPPFFMSSMGPLMTWYMTYCLVLVLAPIFVFAKYRGELLKLKRENGWYSETAGKTLADVKAAVVPVQRINSIWFLIPTLISFIPVAGALFDQENNDPGSLWMYLTFALMIVSFWLLYHLIFRVRAEVVNEDLTLTMALTRIRRHNWGKFWLVSVWLTSALNIAIWLFAGYAMVLLIATLIYTLAIIAVAIKAEFSTRFAQQKLTASDLGDIYVDEDDVWIWGLLYCNPNDDHFMVNARIGMNMSVNLAKTGGKILMIAAALMIAAMPFIGIWIWVEEVTPTALVLTDTDLIARHTTNQYTIPLNSIDTIELIAEMPQVLSRVAGSSFENMQKGRFLVSNYGTASLCIQTNTPPFIMVTANGRTYFINDANSSVTTGIYNQIR